MNTDTKLLTDIEQQAGGGIDPEDGPEAARMVKTTLLRELGLPFRCVGGTIMQDQSLALADELHDSEREARIVYFQHGDEFCSVQYTRPVDIVITAEFEPWPNEGEVLVTLYDEDDFGKLRMRGVGDEAPAVH